MKPWVRTLIIVLLISATSGYAVATPPQVVSTNPSYGTTNVPCDMPVVSITFSEPMQHVVSITSNGTWSPYTVSWSDDSKTVYLTRTSGQPLSPGTYVAFTLNPEGMLNFRDLDGDFLPTYTFSFTIVPDCQPNNVIPYVVSTSPANAETGVPCQQTVVSITFNEPMQHSHSITSNWGPFEISWSNDSTIIYLTRPSGQPLSPGIQITLVLNPEGAPNFQDLQDNFLPTYTFSFTIGEDCQSNGTPYVVGTYPQNGAIGVPRDLPYISITFSEPMKASSSTLASNWVPSTQSWSEDQKTFYITPTAPNKPNFGAQVIFTLNPSGYNQSFQDLEGNPLQPYTFSFTVVDDPRLHKIEANPEKGFHWPYYLFVPDTPSPYTVLLVEPNNTGTSSDDPMFHDNAAHNLICNHSWFAVDLNVPLLVPTFPRPNTPQAPEPGGVYTHALDRYSLNLSTLPENLKRVDLQLIAMIEDAKEKFKDFGYYIDNKVFLMGFSASGAFVSRFTILHPELVKAVAPGSPGGWPTAPLSEWEGIKLWYPVGVADVEQLTGNPFDLNAFRAVPKYIYVGDQDTNDALDIRGMPQEDREAICQLLNCNPYPYIANRWPISEQMYDSAGANGQFKIYPGVAHHFTEEIWSDLKAFFEQHKSNDVQIDPNEGTFGTELTITGYGFGTKKGKVLIGSTPLTIVDWADGLIHCSLKKVLAPGPYDVTIQPSGPKGTPSIIVKDGFTVKAAEIHSVEQGEGSAYDQVTITGKFFGEKKGAVYLEYGEGENLMRKSCRVNSWTMDPTTGDSEIVFIVPVMPHEVYDVVVDPYGTIPDTEDEEEHGFTIKAPKIVSITPNSGSVSNQITISGNFFGSKKPKVYLGYMNVKNGKYTKKSCSVSSWPTDPTKEEGEIVFTVPNLPAETYDVIVTNSVSSTTLSGGFVIK